MSFQKLRVDYPTQLFELLGLRIQMYITKCVYRIIADWSSYGHHSQCLETYLTALSFIQCLAFTIYSDIPECVIVFYVY